MRLPKPNKIIEIESGKVFIFRDCKPDVKELVKRVEKKVVYGEEILIGWNYYQPIGVELYNKNTFGVLIKRK